MPMIDSKITVQVPQEKRDVLKAELGKAVAILGKPESYLMLGFEDNYDLYFGGKKLDKGAGTEAISKIQNKEKNFYDRAGKILQQIR